MTDVVSVVSEQSTLVTVVSEQSSLVTVVDRGQQGPIGEQGPQGIQGDQGIQGEQGEIGETGPQGAATAIQGAIPDWTVPPANPTPGDAWILDGIAGAPNRAYDNTPPQINDGMVWDAFVWENVGPLRGPTGDQGIQGETGDTGAQGDQGIQGIQGDKGDTGDQGDIGNTGAQGIQGEQGDQGVKGDTGDKGDLGDTGPQGTATTIQGSVPDWTAPNIPVGPASGDAYILDGTTGAPNRSYDNSPAQVGDGMIYDGVLWFNGGPLRGPEGDTGTQGLTGDQGVQGIKGDQGDQGIQGIQGNTGIQGIQGVKGDTGDKGDQGDKGDLGNTGPQGIQGIKGDTGDKGDQGDKGDLGNTGPQGIQGIQGFIGDQGGPGNTGPVGVTGPAGPQGGVTSFFYTAIDPSVGTWDFLGGVGNLLRIANPNNLIPEDQVNMLVEPAHTVGAIPESWTAANNSSNLEWVATPSAQLGAGYLRFEADSDDNLAICRMGGNGGRPACIPSTEYTWSAWCLNESSTSMSVNVGFYTALGQFLGQAVGPGTNIGANTWALLKISFTTTADTVELNLDVRGRNVLTGQKFRIGPVGLMLGNQTSSITIPPSLTNTTVNNTSGVPVSHLATSIDVGDNAIGTVQHTAPILWSKHGQVLATLDPDAWPGTETWNDAYESEWSRLGTPVHSPIQTSGLGDIWVNNTNTDVSIWDSLAWRKIGTNA